MEKFAIFQPIILCFSEKVQNMTKVTMMD